MTNYTKPQQQSQNLQSKQFKSETFWKTILLLISVLATFLIKNIYQFQTNPKTQTVRMGSPKQLFGFGLLFSFFFTLLDLLIHKIFDSLCYKHYLNIDKYPLQQQRIKRSYTLVKWGYSLIYYIFTSFAAYSILVKTSAFPTWLGGSGDPYNFYKYAPYIPQATQSMRIFYIVQFGKHFSRFFGHVFLRPQGNFYEYALHHGLSCFLMMYSYLTNFWLVGIMLLLLHDITDCTLICGRGYRQYKYMNKYLIQFFYVVGFLNWFLWRIFVFCYACIYPGILYALKDADQALRNQFTSLITAGYFMILMMIALQIMQLFWTYYLVRSFLSVSVTNKIKHNYDGYSNLSNDKEKKEQQVLNNQAINENKKQN